MKTIQKVIMLSVATCISAIAFGQLGLGVTSTTQAAVSATANTAAATQAATVASQVAKSTVNAAISKTADIKTTTTATANTTSKQAVNTTNQVKNELSSQKIYFPAAGSAALDPVEFPGLQKYAGQLVDNGPKAKAYANEFIGVHLQKVAGGKTYSEVSALAMKDPTNTALQTQKAVLFQGETLRGLLLGDGYAYWTFGMLALYAAMAAFFGAAVMTLLVLLGLAHLSRLK